MAFCSQCGQQLPLNSKFCIKCGHQLEESTAAAKRGPPPLPTTPPSASGASNVGASNPQNVVTPMDVYGTFLRRFAAYIIDYFLIALVFSILTAVLLPSSDKGDKTGQSLLTLVACAWLYKAISESSPWQATLGKRLFNIKVTGLNGERIGFGRATGRFFSQILSQLSFGIGYLMAALTKRHQALHDLIAGTLVIKRGITNEEVLQNPSAPRGDGASGVVIVAVVSIIMVGVIGILAAIAIPAYQNYTIRAQVTHALLMTDAYKTAITESMARGVDPGVISTGTDNFPAQGLPSRGQYEESIQVVQGNVMVTFGGSANPRIYGKKLMIFFLNTPQGDVVWVCGRGELPKGGDSDSLAQLRTVTDVQDQYLPTSCHS
jgi:uncharacterized RDD family membrane protein YckC/Tfp pilus assembly major pilin PilA